MAKEVLGVNSSRRASGKLPKWDRLNCHSHFFVLHPSSSLLFKKKQTRCLEKEQPSGERSTNTRDENPEKGAGKSLGAC